MNALSFQPAFEAAPAITGEISGFATEAALAQPAAAALVSDAPQPRKKPLLRVGLALSGSLLAAACTSGPSEQPSPSSAAVPSAETVDHCAPPGEQAFEARQFLCESRRVGDLLVVVAPGLSDVPTIDLTNPAGDVMQVARYATDGLRAASDGAIDLTPKVVVAPDAALQAVKSANPGGCIAVDPPENRMSSIIAPFMPEMQEAAQTVVIGGRSCGDERGNVGGMANPEAHTADVYAESRPGFSINQATPITTTGGIVMHELLHNWHFEHAGTLYFTDWEAMRSLQEDPARAVDIPALLEQDFKYDSVGDLGNIASNTICNVTPDNDCLDWWLNPKQRDFLLHNAYPDKENIPYETPLLLPTTKITIQDEAQAGEQRAVEVPVPSETGNNGYLTAVGGLPFTRVVFDPYAAKTNRPAGVRILLATGESTGYPMTTVSLGSFTVAASARTFTVGNTKVSVSRNGAETRLTSVR